MRECATSKNILHNSLSPFGTIALHIFELSWCNNLALLVVIIGKTICGHGWSLKMMQWFKRFGKIVKGLYNALIDGTSLFF